METTGKKITVEQIVDLIKEHGTLSDKVISSLKISWTQVGYNLTVNGYSIEYKTKSQS